MAKQELSASMTQVLINVVNQLSHAVANKGYRSNHVIVLLKGERYKPQKRAVLTGER